MSTGLVPTFSYRMFIFGLNLGSDRLSFREQKQVVVKLYKLYSVGIRCLFNFFYSNNQSKKPGTGFT